MKEEMTAKLATGTRQRVEKLAGGAKVLIKRDRQKEASASGFLPRN